MNRRTILTIAATLVLLGGLALRRWERLRAEQERFEEQERAAGRCLRAAPARDAGAP
jgi:hypothetical protein